MKQYKIKKESFMGRLSDILNSGTGLFAPAENRGIVDFARINDVGEIVENYIQTAMSPKYAIFPSCEELTSYEKKEGNIVVKAETEITPETVVFGARPCDAAGLAYLNEFFAADYSDYHMAKRMEKTTVISLSCSKCDGNCFCTSVGGGPGAVEGSDINLTDMGDGIYLVETATEKGEAFVSKFPDSFEAAENIDKKEYLADVPVKFNSRIVAEKIAGSYGAAFWQEASMACLGCGACAFSCPTCSCFDIQDENNPKRGARLRLWDSCGFGLFTLHASGHNPREIQSARWKHRVMHKFRYSEENLNRVSCAGCGRCSRNCPAGMNITETLKLIAEA